jgi:DNA-binding NarL/FixJ family response regulator
VSGYLRIDGDEHALVHARLVWHLASSQGRPGVVFHVQAEGARTLLHLGAAQRRAKHKLAARTSLAAALRIFRTLGAAPWRAKTADELARISGRQPSGGGLTPTEARIVALVAEGQTNKQVAAALYLSPKTVEANLRNVFRKLGVRSRTALARKVLTDGQSAGIPSLPNDAPHT